MNHDQAQLWLHGHVDGELDLNGTFEIEQHLQTCEACANSYQELLALRSALRIDPLYYRAPARLRRRIQSSVRQAGASPSIPSRLFQILPGLALGLVVGAILMLGLVRILPASSPDNQLADEVLASHLRSLMGAHLTDVASSDQHTVKPWFDGKVDFSPNVLDLKDQGFPLIGGRLDYLDNRPVAALVYQRRLHVVNLFVWPSGGSDMNGHSAERQGYHLLYWNQSAMTYWAVSDVSLPDLQTFVQLIQRVVAPAPEP